MGGSEIAGMGLRTGSAKHEHQNGDNDKDGTK